jgi:hypothetical protein
MVLLALSEKRHVSWCRYPSKAELWKKHNLTRLQKAKTPDLAGVFWWNLEPGAVAQNSYRRLACMHRPAALSQPE